MAKSEKTMEAAVINFYREEIRRRYQLENVRRFKTFDPVSDEVLAELRDFFMERLYPEMEQREALDHAIDQLGGLLRSPRRLRPLIKTAIASLWRLGAQLPAAIATGLKTVDSLTETRQLEQEMVAQANRIGLKKKDLKRREMMVQVLTGVPEKAVMKLIYDILDLFKSLSNVKMLGAMLQIMERSIEVMESNPKLYKEEERAGVALGIEVVRGGHGLFLDLKPKHFKAIIKGIEEVELDWYQSLLEESATSGAA